VLSLFYIMQVLNRKLLFVSSFRADQTTRVIVLSEDLNLLNKCVASELSITSCNRIENDIFIADSCAHVGSPSHSVVSGTSSSIAGGTAYAAGSQLTLGPGGLAPVRPVAAAAKDVRLSTSALPAVTQVGGGSRANTAAASANRDEVLRKPEASLLRPGLSKRVTDGCRLMLPCRLLS